MRVFFAIELPADLQESLVQFTETLQGDLRRVRAEQIHLTLRFVGEVPDDQVPALIAAARPAFLARPLTLQVRGGGFYGLPTLPRVLWAGVRGEVQRLMPIVHALERAVQRLGYPPSRRKFSPHVTLARVGGRVPPVTIERLTTGVPAAELPVTEVTLFRSERLPGGARHTALERFPLRR